MYFQVRVPGLSPYRDQGRSVVILTSTHGSVFLTFEYKNIWKTFKNILKFPASSTHVRIFVMDATPLEIVVAIRYLILVSIQWFRVVHHGLLTQRNIFL